MPEEEAPREYVLTEILLALRHLDLAMNTSGASLAEMRGKLKHHNAECTAERATGFMLSAVFALQRCVEFIEDQDFEKIECRFKCVVEKEGERSG